MRLSRVVFVSLGSLAGLGGCGGTRVTKSASTTTTSSSAGGAGGAAAASTSSQGGAGGANIGQPSTMYPAKFPQPPQVEFLGGAVLSSPKIVPVYFSGDDPTFVSSLTDFTAKIGATQFWKAATTEYGVGAATSLAPVMLTETAPSTIDDTAIQTWLAGKLNSNDAAFPPADANTVYLLYYPPNVTITLSGGPGGASQSCQSFGGYHSNIELDANHSTLPVSYAVIPRCADFGGLTGVDAITATATHELVEAVTDPYPSPTTTFPNGAAAYGQVDQNHIIWERILGGGEVGDMCAQFPDSFTKFPELSYTVQRTWSNKAAKTGHDPCVPPLGGEVYFNGAPVLTDNVVATIFGQTITTKGVNIPVGQAKTIDIDLYSDGDTGGPWTVNAQDLSSFGGQAPHLSFSFDAVQGQNGQVLHLTITVLAAGKSKTETFSVDSDLNGQHHGWIGIVGSP